ncbi:MAG: glycoside hydrolase family 3 C-terminal domain-containing protein [Bacteroidetes bacterium]|nr:glycoside hydrolase family 3 C-terminal domain-containing protein [Bacteroidota bacterium]MBU2585734.1 glycoside hydrolase family 3 C-terminal domain-containing protein [Bacteroidota bacterium]
MRIAFLIIAISLLFLGGNINEQKSQLSEIDKKVQNLISKMTLEEKVGQMTQVTLQAVSKTQGTVDHKHLLDEDKLNEAITKYHVGSILNVFDVAHSLDYWHEIISKIQDIATKKTKLGIPIIYGIDAIHGANYALGATLFPQPLSQAASWNTELVKKIGAVTSLETRASGIPWNFYPVMDLGRQPLWPRLWETFGEDVHLACKMGKSYIKGAQGSNIGNKDKLAICLKHYVGYSFPINGRDRTPAWISERMLREYFLPPFQAGIEAGALTIMVNSSEVNGIPSHSDYHLLTEILRDELKFEGFVVSDWEDIARLHFRDKVAESPKEAVRMAVMAGVDMSMVPYDFSFYNLLVELVNEGSVPMLRIDEAVSRILKVKFMLGLFDNPYPQQELKEMFASKESTELNLEAARESIILTKNENEILPLSRNRKILITGPTANLLSVMNGGWTITWQGNEEKLYPKDKKTVLEAIKDKVGKNRVQYVEGISFGKEINIKKAVSEAKKSDAVILCLGENAYCESPGNIDDLTLDEIQLKFAKEIINAGKPVILVLLQGRPRLIEKIEKDVTAILLGFLPGMEGGIAIADILFGDVNPSGKLPITYPRKPNGIVHYDYKPIESFDVNTYNPQWAFGHGLSYTEYEFSNLTFDKNEISPDENLIVTVQVKNVGKIAGKEVVQLYLSDHYGTVSRPVKQLKGFEKVYLNPGESKTVTFSVTPYHLSFIGRDNKRIIEPGDFSITVGNLSGKFSVRK